MPRTKGSGSAAWRDPSGVESASPEQRLLAALVRLTVYDACAGDPEAIEWLIADAPGWLVYLLPDTITVGDVHVRLLRLAGCASGLLGQAEAP